MKSSKEKIHNYSAPPSIPRIDDGEARPFWSVMIPVYNSFSTLAETLNSVLVQAFPKEQMQIEVVDDGSTDGDVKKLVDELGKGRISYYAHQKNEGSLATFETCLKRAKGKIIHLLHADDKVRNGYYSKIGNLFEQYPQIGAAFCRYAIINDQSKILWEHGKEMEEEGILNNWLTKIASKQRLQYCTISVKREVYENLGGFYGVTYGEDWEMWVRIAAHYAVAYTPEILAEYRVHTNSISHRAFMNAKHVREMRWVMNTIQKWLPDDQRKKLRKESMRSYALYAVGIANTVWHQTGKKRITHKLMLEAARMYLNGEILRKMAKIYTKILINRR